MFINYRFHFLIMFTNSDTKTVCSSLKLRWKGIFDFDTLYKEMKRFLEVNGLGDENSNFVEEKYAERIKGDSKQLEIRWKGERIVNDYFSYTIEITFLVLDLKAIKVKKDDEEIGTNTGDIEMRFSANLVLNRMGRWKPDGLMKKLYDKYIIKDRIEQHMIELYKLVYRLRDDIKARLELHRF